MQSKTPNISKLKQFALEKLPANSTLRDVILGERDELGVEEFLAKIDIWLKLIKKGI